MVGQPRSRTRRNRGSSGLERSDSAHLPRIGNMIATATSCGNVDSSIDSQIWTWRPDSTHEIKELDTSVSLTPIILEQESLKSREIFPIALQANLPDAGPRLAKEQIDELETFFQQHHKPSTSARRRLAERLGIPLDKVNNWFQNRRAKVKQSLIRSKNQNAHQTHSLESHITSFTPPIGAPPIGAPSYSSPLLSDWSFLQTPPDSNTSGSPACPSLASGSTISSRNSSTRSTQALRWQVGPRESEDLDCNEILGDRKWMLRILGVAVERCPVKTCNFHDSGFHKASDMMRHAITHFKGTITCGFCPDSTAVEDKAYELPDKFSIHLAIDHGARLHLSSGLEHLNCDSTLRKPMISLQEKSSAIQIATCTLCLEPFDLQSFIEHLTGCLYRKVVEAEESKEQLASKPDIDSLDKGSPRNDSVITQDEGQSVAANAAQCPSQSSPSPQTPNEMKQQADNISEKDEQDISELTASSRCLSLTSSHGFSKSSDEETDWTDDPSSPSSEPDPSGALCPLKQQLVDETMKEFHRLFNQLAKTVENEPEDQISTCANGSSSGSSQGYSGGSFVETSPSGSSKVSRKRSLSNRSLPPNGDKNNGDDPNKRQRPDSNLPTSKDSPLPERRFACPYYKRNPGRHQTFTSCRDPGFITVARLKEHLYRRHLLPIQCHRCCSTFPNEPTLREHQRDARVCEVQEHVPLEGFDKDQERKLKSKKRCQLQQNEEDKWKGVYRILFPDDDEDKMPSPYIEYQAQGNPNPTSNVTRFQEFSRLELPRLVRQTLEVVVEQEAQPLEEKLKDRLVNIVKECQAQLFSMFDGSIESGNDDTGPPSTSCDAQNVDLSPHHSSLSESMTASFKGFESASIGSGLPPSPPYTTVTQIAAADPSKSNSTVPQNPSDTPDSNVLEFTEPSIVFHTTFPQISADPEDATYYGSNDYSGLNGYYGLFETQDNHFDQSIWPFGDTTQDPGTYPNQPAFQ